MTTNAAKTQDRTLWSKKLDNADHAFRLYHRLHETFWSTPVCVRQEDDLIILETWDPRMDAYTVGRVAGEADTRLREQHNVYPY